MADPVIPAVLTRQTIPYGVDHATLSDAERAAGPCDGKLPVAAPRAPVSLPTLRAAALIASVPTRGVSLPKPPDLDLNGDNARRYLFVEEGDRVAHGLHLADPSLDASALTDARDQWVARNVARTLNRRAGDGDAFRRMSWRTMMLAVARENEPGDPLLPLARRTVEEMTREMASSGYTPESAAAQLDRWAETFSRTSRGWREQAAILRSQSYYRAATID